MMRKAEADHDYYGDLEVDPTADANEIKKAFKKLALKYHPDRNPGKELEYNSKFQAIQSANEVLTDPQQRAKYDAQRIRSGYLHTYTNATPPPSRSTASARTTAAGTSNFPPPPRPPPPPQPKPAFTSSQQGAQKYANVRFSRPETASAYSRHDDTKTKTNDYKAWEQMRARHGQGPIPSGRAPPPKPPRASTVQPEREPTATTSTGPTPRRSNWDRFQESQTGMPGITRSNTTKFAPRTPGGDEPQAQGSAYFKVSRDERPANARTQMPPPPSPAPTARKPDPLQAFREQVGLNEPFGKSKARTSTAPQTAKGDHLRPSTSPGPGLRRSATSAVPRDNNNRTGRYEKDSGGIGVSHMRAASASSPHHHSTSPPGTKSTQLPGMYSSTSSSASSSGDERVKRPAKVYTDPPNARQARGPISQQSRRGFNLYANVGDEGMASVGTGGYNGIRRHSAVDLKADRPPEGFQEHRMKHDTQHSEQPSTNSTASRSPASNDSQPSLARSQSWQERYRQDRGDRSESSPKGAKGNSAEGEQAAKTSMYDSPGYNPFPSPPSCGPPSSGTLSSGRWSDQWPFHSPKRAKTRPAEAPPYWAIPSSLPPLPKVKYRKKEALHTLSCSTTQSVPFADHDPFSSFTLPKFADRAASGPPPPRSHSSDNIDTNFSPDGWHGKFFEPPASRTATPLRTVSSNVHGVAQPEQNQQLVEEQSPSHDNIPPPPHSQHKYSEEHWLPNLNNIKFDAPPSPQANSPIRQGNRSKRLRARGPKLATVQPTVRDVDDEPTAMNASGDGFESSKANVDVDAMDIDQPTPPKNAIDGQVNGDTIPIQHPKGTTAPRRVPTLPPRKNGYTQAHTNSEKLNLNDLRNTYPFAPSNEGLNNMNDIAIDLPFESRASPTKPNLNGSSQRVELPKPPVCPQPPLSLTDTSCDRFCRQVHAYMEEWNNFNAKMSELLATRRSFNKGNSGFTLLNVEDDGYDEYMKGLEESRRTRAHFEVAADNHYKTMQDLGLTRQEMKRGRGGVLA